jgi:tetratricopeptide (TPR) repeat protein
MNKKEYLVTLIAILIIDVALIITGILQYLQWTWIFVIIAAGYLYLRYKLSGPLQVFSNKFNMLVDYDLDVQGAKELCQSKLNEAPTKSTRILYSVYLGMATYYCGEYEDAIKVFNQIELKKLNTAYHVLIFAFTAYSAYELGDMETFNISIERIRNIQNTVNRRFLGFVSSYIQVLEAMQNLEDNPEHYREVIESQFSRNDGYISTKLTYNYRMAHYYRVINDELEMDKCLAKVIANGKEHHTALQARKMFKNTVNVEDYIFEEEQPIEDVETVEDQQLLTHEVDGVESIEEVETIDEIVKDDDLFK